MEKKTIPLGYIRGLVVAQGIRCAITGLPLDPQEVNADHIIPLPRADLKPGKGEDNIWLVHKKINAMKGTMTYTEFVEACRDVLDHHEKTKSLLQKIQKGEIQPISKFAFDEWIEERCEPDGTLRIEQGAPADADKPNR